MLENKSRLSFFILKEKIEVVYDIDKEQMLFFIENKDIKTIHKIHFLKEYAYFEVIHNEKSFNVSIEIEEIIEKNLQKTDIYLEILDITVDSGKVCEMIKFFNYREEQFYSLK